MVRNRLTRSGFTLIEMMVAMALSLGIMLILTESFKMALDFVRGANSTGELISQLNGAGILMTRDLQADHFLDPKTATNGPKLSDQRFDLGVVPPTTGGFFRIVAPAPSPQVEQIDPQGFNINYPSAGHQLHFTSLLPIGASASSFTAKSTAGGFYNSEAAEIGYFLVQMPGGKKTSTTGQPLYNLIRREKLVAKTTAEQTSLAMQSGDNTGDYQSIVSTPGANANTLLDLVAAGGPTKRMNPLASMSYASGAPRYGEDIVVSNVLSFEVLADWSGAPAAAAFPGNTDAPYDFVPGGSFDTGSATPPTIRVKGLQVVIRIYDPRMKQSRQNTWKFAM